MEVKLRIRYFWKIRFFLHSFTLHNMLYQQSFSSSIQKHSLKKWDKILFLCIIRTPTFDKIGWKKCLRTHARKHTHTYIYHFSSNLRQGDSVQISNKTFIYFWFGLCNNTCIQVHVLRYIFQYWYIILIISLWAHYSKILNWIKNCWCICNCSKHERKVVDCDIVTAQRDSLEPKKVDMLIFLIKNLK